MTRAKAETGFPAADDFVLRFSCTVEEIPPELRLDRYVAEKLKLLSRSQIKARNLRAKVNGKEIKLSRLLRPGDKLELCWEDACSTDLVPEDIPLDIVYEDERVAVVNKAQGMVVHPGAGNWRGTLANALCYLRERRGRGRGEAAAGLRPGIVHRLDKDTSGLIITAWDEKALAFLAEQFKKRKVIKTYAAIVQGRPEESGRVETMIGRSKRNRKLFAVTEGSGKHSLTLFRVVRSWGNYSLVLLRPKTGRTHQLRVHMRHIGHPILGDSLYGLSDSKFPRSTLMLHAKRLSIVLPEIIPGGTMKTFRTSFPPRFTDLISILNGKKRG